MNEMTRDSLIARIAAGERFDFFFFWGHTPKAPGTVDRSCLSQWFASPFTVDDVSYPTAEHFMMSEKARLFDDVGSLERILAASTPAEAKSLGREVTPFEPARWAAARFDAVVRGNVAKFSAHDELKRFLLSTGSQVLVEAAPRDVVWGIGLGASNVDATNPSKWRGLNLLGFALMEARARLTASETT